VLLGGCGSGDVQSLPTRDGGWDVFDSADVATETDALPDSSECAPDQHRCSDQCVNEQANDVAVGCRYGCGTPCPEAPDNADATCSVLGQCDFTCRPPFARAGEACLCAATTCESVGATCGLIDNGCGGTTDCGSCSSGACMGGSCVCSADAGEPNGSRIGSRGLGAFTDQPDTTMTFGTYAVSTATDHDWYRAAISDTGLDSNPVIRVTLGSVPTRSDYNLEVFYACDDGVTTLSCLAGSAVGDGCASASPGGDIVELQPDCSGTIYDSGSAFIHIVPATWAGSCSPYSLEVFVY